MGANHETYRNVKSNPYLKVCPITDEYNVQTQYQQVSLGVGAKKMAESITMLASVKHPPSDHFVVKNIHGVVGLTVIIRRFRRISFS